MASIDWGKIAGQVVGGIVNVFAPGAGAITQKVIESGIDIATDVVQKIKTGKEAGKTDSQVMETLTAQDRAKLVSETNEQAILNQKVEAAFLEWVNSQSAADKMLSKWRKNAKMAGKNPDAAETFAYNGTIMTYGKETLNVSDLVIFAGFPNFKTSNQVIQQAMLPTETTGTGGTNENLNLAEVEDEFQGPGSQGQQTAPKKTSYAWFFLALLAVVVWWFFLRVPGMKKLKQLKAARAAKKRKNAEMQAQKKAEAAARAEAARKTRLQNQKNKK